MLTHHYIRDSRNPSFPYTLWYVPDTVVVWTLPLAYCLERVAMKGILNLYFFPHSLMAKEWLGVTNDVYKPWSADAIYWLMKEKIHHSPSILSLIGLG
jgi:hypothetical protein